MFMASRGGLHAEPGDGFLLLLLLLSTWYVASVYPLLPAAILIVTGCGVRFQVSNSA